ncbi:hypothetical protein RhiJN_20768 [Ceratobasidium sp. AG-Ba]|nr:hypothetical protein RhiJN_20768 [Ceratobasidium sp. AG-Ba]
MDSSSGSSMENALPNIALHLLAVKYVLVTSFVILVYDHLITLSEEIDRVWRKEWTGATWLFALNRYLTELQLIVDIVAYHDPYWVGKAYVRLRQK